jgi:CBS domain-containing protein
MNRRDGLTGTNGLRRSADLLDTPVAAIMGRPPVTIGVTLGLDVALRTLAAHGLRHLVVVDAGACVGLLSDRVVASIWAGEPMRFEVTPVGDVCDGIRPFVGVDASLADVARAMRRCGTDAVVVVDGDGRPLGVVTTTDIVALMAKPRLPGVP